MMKNRNIAVDFLKIVLAVFVVGLHCNLFIDYSKPVYFETVEGLFRISVPIFFVINGYYFKNTIDRGVVLSWIKRVLILYVLWMLIYSPFWFFTSDLKGSLIRAFKGHFHLWYLSAMLISGIVLNVFRKFPNIFLFIVALLLFIIGCSIQYFGNYHIFGNTTLDDLCNNMTVYRSFLFFGLPFFTLGYLINSYKANTLLSNNLMYLGGVGGLLLLVIESYLNYINTGESIDCLFSLIVVCPFIFMYFLNVSIDLKINSQFIAMLSTAIYLIHPLVMDFVHNVFPTYGNIEGFLIIVLFSIVASFLLVWINKKVKYLL